VFSFNPYAPNLILRLHFNLHAYISLFVLFFIIIYGYISLFVLFFIIIYGYISLFFLFFIIIYGYISVFFLFFIIIYGYISLFVLLIIIIYGYISLFVLFFIIIYGYISLFVLFFIISYGYISFVLRCIIVPILISTCFSPSSLSLRQYLLVRRIYYNSYSYTTLFFSFSKKTRFQNNMYIISGFLFYTRCSGFIVTEQNIPTESQETNRFVR
jgi:hypothetical protein